MSEKPEALRLANALRDGTYLLSAERDATEAALRRQHAEIERLKADNERLQNTKHYEAPFGFVLNPDYLVPELKAENERLREENERYRWLQANALSIDLVFDPDNFVQVYAGTDPAQVFRGRTLDDAVSEAMKEAARRREET